MFVVAFPAPDSDVVYVPCHFGLSSFLTLAYRDVMGTIEGNTCICVPVALLTEKIAELFNHFGYLLLLCFPYPAVYD